MGMRHGEALPNIEPRAETMRQVVMNDLGLRVHKCGRISYGSIRN